ncbi:breast cancer type 1 susceptibility protein homolog [Zerene cesonia]|uniref:breast cancer type 1 susceptibility protein homolog n=1 Tax=Zerene cesonia TaxID=33412 RepID=UPI0018E4E289|nr:breast cancer type 1 susceptibility protein homolog [Zerene cesonia]
MNYESILQTIDLNRISKITSLQVDHVTCIECCKYYIVPTTAKCGHTLCHTCWHGRQTCPACGSKIDRKTLRLNLVLQNLTEHVHHLADAFQNLFNIKLDDFFLSPGGDLLSVKDPNKNVQDWLASSQNHFSAPVSSQNSIQEMNVAQKVIVSDIQVHTETKKNPRPINAIFVPMEQKDWDKIEELPDSEDVLNKDKENIIGPMDIETYNFMPNDDNTAYSTHNPRRSSRKKDSKESDSVKTLKLTKLNKNNKDWKNVRKMKKEFSKLNTKNKNKLNVSIEMCKKVKSCNDLMNKITPQYNKKNIYNNNDDDSGNDTIENDKKIEKSCSPMQLDDKIDINAGHINKNSSTELIKTVEKNASEHENYKFCDVDKNCAEHLTSSQTEKEKPKKPNVCFFKKNVLIGKNTIPINETENAKMETFDTDDIEITIKIGSTLTNICIKKKDNDVQLKINSDREIQTALDKQNSKICGSTSPIKDISDKNTTQQDKYAQADSLNPNSNEGDTSISQKLSTKTKKNTASADTASANMEITESIERELSTVMENVQAENRSSIVSKANTLVKDLKNKDIVPNDDELNDLDMFDSESVKEGNVQSLKALGHVPSTILTSNLNKLRTQKIVKRDRDASDIEQPCSKKTKTKDTQSTERKLATQKSHNDSELGNYDEIMSQVFANIDADMKNLHKSKDSVNVSNTLQNILQATINRRILQSQNKNTDKMQGNIVTEKYSESIFTLMEKDNEDLDLKQPTQSKNDTIINKRTNDAKKLLEEDMEIIELSTPQHNDDDSGESVVDETPQKNNSFAKNKHTDLILNKDKVLKLNQCGKSGTLKNDKKFDESQGVIDITSFSGTVGDSTKNSRNITVVEQPKVGINFTPISINKFVDHIKHNSTPVSRKSLNFNDSIDIDLEKTVCPSNFVAAKNTQEKEIMCEAFEQNVMPSPNNRKNLKYYVAGSCLSLSEKANVKQLCAQRNWVFVEKYTKELTHLIVSVDEEKKAQRSAKFMCALAASKWIVAYEWVEKCLKTNQVVDEEPYEALDVTGEPGPKRSRLAKQKLFNGIKFFCMPPFGVLDVDTLKEILEAAGGTVVNQAKAVEVTQSPALLLAEPESTQEDRFIYLAMELCIVPVNYEWVLNCLGSYTLCSIHELLLCPSSLLPPATSKWPAALMTRENDSLIE